MEEIKCIFCKSGNDSIVIKENGYEGRKCFKCNLIYISPRPSVNEIFDLYGHDNAHLSAKSHISGEFLKRIYAKHNLRIINSFSSNGTILEIGAGAGYFLDEARKLGLEPYGIEFNPIQANFIREKLKIPCEESSLSTAIFEGKKFDIIYHCDVLSHFFDPISEFRKIHERMKENGLLVFETGNLGEVNQKYFKYFQKFQYPDHLFFFSSDNLIYLLESNGFEFMRIYKYSILPQLIFIKAIFEIKDVLTHIILRSKWQVMHPPDGSSAENLYDINSKSYKTNSIAKKIMQILYNYSNYILRYKIGQIAPKIYRPQTVIVVARKKN